jgi:hypothetical protein
VPVSTDVQPLRQLQQSLQAFYRIQSSLDIADFLTTDIGDLESLGIDTDSIAEETVYVRSGPEAIEISLYLDPATLARLAASNGPQYATGLNDYCLVAEGVSHFVFLVERACQSRQTTAFELELQAEIDKYLLLAGVCAEPSEELAHDIFTRLFNAAALRDGLDAAAAGRYGDANRYAARYCRYLRRLGRDSSTLQRTMDEELRHFYHLPLAEKVQRIESRPGA